MGVQKGLLIVVSAGNEGGNNWGKITFPGDVDGVLTVGAVSPNLKPAYFSGRGFTADGRIKPDIMGIGVTAATITSEGKHGMARRDLVFRTDNSRTYSLSATSSSRPFCTGNRRTYQK